MDEVAMLVIPVLCIIFGFALIRSVMDNRAAARAERVKLLEEALKNPAIDRATLESLAFQLTGARRPRQEGPSKLLSLILGLGWLALFAGIGVWVLGEVIGEPDAIAGGIVTSIMGFGLVTYPFALRELEARRVQP